MRAVLHARLPEEAPARARAATRLKIDYVRAALRTGHVYSFPVVADAKVAAALACTVAQAAEVLEAGVGDFVFSRWSMPASAGRNRFA